MNRSNSTFSIKDWKDDDKPREKMLSKGKEVVSDAELVAILIGSGSRSESAVELSKRILSHVDNNLNNLARLTFEQLVQFKGIGQAKAVSIITALELGRRRRLEQALKLSKVTSSKEVFEILQPLIGELKHEEFWILYLNNSNKIIHKSQLSKGGITSTVVDTRMIFKKALELSATALIIAHNHPSGTLKPSEVDKNLTQKIKTAGQTLDIKIIDHLIITEKAYFSFADQNIL